MKRLARMALGVLLLLTVASASGCMDLSGREAIVMSVDLYWDKDTKGSSFEPDTCGGAGVETMSWTLSRSDTGDKVASDSGKCSNGIDVIDPTPAEYTLQITGKDADGNALWHASCKGLRALRFDVGYSCDIDGAPQ